MLRKKKIIPKIHRFEKFFFFGFFVILALFSGGIFLFTRESPDLPQVDITLSNTHPSSQEDLLLHFTGDPLAIADIDLRYEQKRDVPVVAHLQYEENSSAFLWGKRFLSWRRFFAEPVFASVSGNIANDGSIHIQRPEDFHPGDYELTAHDQGGNILFEKKFTWGILAVNFDKSVYAPHETVQLMFGILDADGATICGDDLEATITAPDGTESFFSTQTKTLHLAEKCGDQSIDAEPDYTTQYIPQSAGTYRVVARVPDDTNSDAEKIVEDRFLVTDAPAFDIERQGPTRIYPVQSYPVTITVTARENWSGDVQEFVPSSFEISNISDEGTLAPLSETRSLIQWHTSLRAGEAQTFTYTFHAPPISPEFYLLGPLAVGVNFSETRQWQIASDAQTRRTCNWNGTTNNAWGTAGNWSCGFVPDNASCLDTSNGTCYYVKINSGSNTPVLLGSTSRTVSSFVINASSASATIDSTGVLTVENQGGSQAGGFTVGQVDVTNGTLNLNPSSTSTCLVSNSAAISASGIVTSSNSNCTWSNATGSFTNSGTMTGSWSLTTQSDLTNNSSVNMTGGLVKFSGTAVSTLGCSATQSNNKFYSLQASKSIAGSPVTLSGSCIFGGTITIDTNNQLTTGTGSHAMTTTGTGLIVNNGTFTATSGNTWAYTGTGSTTIPALTYHHLAFQPASGSPTHTLGSGTFTVNGNFTVGNDSATATVSTSGNNPTVNITGDLTVNSNATLSGDGSGTITVNGNMAGVGTINLTGGTLEQRVSSGKNFATTAGARSWTFNNLTFSNSHATTPVTITTQSGGSTPITVGGTLRIGKSGDSATSTTTLNASSRSWVLNGSVATPLTILSSPAGDLSGSSASFTYSGVNGSGDVTVTAETYSSLTVNGSGETYNVTGTVNTGTMTITDGTVDVNGAGALTATSDLTVNGTLQGTGTVTTNGHVTGSGTVSMTGGTFEQRMSAAKNFGTSSGTNAWTFNNLTFSNGHGSTPMSATTNSGGSGGVTVSGTLTIGKSGDGSSASTTLDLGARTWTLSATSTPLVVTSSPAATFTANTSTVNFTGTGTVTIPALTYKNIGLGTTSDSSAGATYALAGNTTVNGTMTVGNASSTNTDTLSLGAGNTLTFKISDTPLTFTSKGTLSGGTSLVSFENTSSSVTVPAADYYDLQFSPGSSTPTFSIGSGTLSVENNLLLTGSGNATVNAETNDPVVDVDGNFTISSGDVFQASSTAEFTIGGNFSNSGTFTENSGTVSFDGSGTTQVTGATTFYKVNVSTPGKTIKFQSASSGSPVFTFSSTFTISGTSGERVSLLSTTSGTQWLANFAANQSSMTYVTVQDSGCGTGSANMQIDNTSTNSGNNGSCWLFGTSANAPTSLAQKKTDDTSVTTGDWISATQIKLTASLSDPDSSDSLQLCAEALPVGTSFANSETACGSSVSFTGTAVTGSVTLTLTEGRAYHWQARIKDAFGNYSSWASFGDNTETERDFGFDATAPTAGTVLDGSTSGTDANFNTGSLTSLSANWSGFSDSASGITRYEYSIGTTSGGTDVKSWTNASTNTSLTTTSLTLTSGVTYYWQVRAIDAAGNTSSAVVSDGQRVLPLPPSSGFSPTKKVKTSSKTPTLSWSSTGDTTVSYEVCLSKKNTPASNCDKNYTTVANKTQVKIPTSSPLDDNTSYFWQVRSTDSLSTSSAWSEVQQFSVATNSRPNITVTKTIGVNVGTVAQITHPFSFLSLIISPALASFGSASDSTSFLQTLVSYLSTSSGILYLALGLFIAGIINIFFTIRKPKHIPAFLLSSPLESFPKIAPKDRDGTWKIPYSTYHRHAKTSKATLASALLVVFLKLSASIFLSVLFTAPQRLAALEDNNKPVVPGDVLTYRLDWKNTGSAPATSFVLSDGIPSGTHYIARSAEINGIRGTDADDSDAITVTSSAVSFSIGNVGAKDSTEFPSSGYVLFDVVVDNPNSQTAIQNKASFSYSEMRVTDLKNTNSTSNAVHTFEISGTIFDDADGDESVGTQESGLRNVKVSLYEDTDGNSSFDISKDTFLLYVLTSSDGDYTFSKLGPNGYFAFVEESTLSSSDFKITTKNGNPQYILLNGDADVTNKNFGYKKPSTDTTSCSDDSVAKKSSVGDRVWHDTDRDRVRDADEEGIAGVGVSLYANNNGASTFDATAHSLISSTTSGADGAYSFGGLGCGDYFVVVADNASVLTSNNYTITKPSVSKAVTLSTRDTHNTSADFGFALPTSFIGDLAYKDADQDGVYDYTEIGVPDLLVRLYRDANHNGILETETDTSVAEVKTNSLGQYIFDSLPTATYFVLIDTTTLPSEDYTLTTLENPKKVVIASDTAYEFVDADFGFSEKTPLITTDPESSEEDEHEDIPEYIDPHEVEYIVDEETKTITKSLLTEISINEQPVFSDGSVVQQNIILPSTQEYVAIQGKAKDCSFCTVTVYVFSDPLTYTTETDAEGRWTLQIPTNVLDSGDHLMLAQMENEELQSSTIRIAFLDAPDETPNTLSRTILSVLIVVITFFLVVAVFLLVYKNNLPFFFQKILRFFPFKKKVRSNSQQNKKGR